MKSTKLAVLACLTALAMSVPAVAENELDDMTLGFAVVQWTYLNCPDEGVSFERYHFANSMIKDMEPKEIRPYWDHIRSLAESVTGEALDACPAFGEAVLAAEQ